MTVQDVYEAARRYAAGCESIAELREVVSLGIDLSEIDPISLDLGLERAWKESRAMSPEQRIRSALKEIEAGKLDLPALIRVYGRAAVAEAAGISLSLLGKLRAKPDATPNSRRVNEDHLIGWLDLDPAFDPTLEILRRREARDE